jgi:hypothetical protein
MNKRDFFLRRLGPACALVLALAVMLAAAPTSLAAQCSGCAWDPEHPGDQVCGDPGGTMKCGGATNGVCDQCPAQEYAAVPADLALDGSALISRAPISEWIESTGVSSSPGIKVRKSICGNVVTARQYTEEAAERMRRTTATLVFE